MTDVFLALLGSDIHLNLTAARGWSYERYVSWATGTLCGLALRKTGWSSAPPDPAGCRDVR